MAAQRFEDVLLGEINKLRLEDLNLNKEKPPFEPLIENDAKHAENITNISAAKLNKSKQDLLNDKETNDKIFDSYFTSKRLAGGTGLGLSVVLGIAEARQGPISVSSESGGAPAFQVYLPLVNREEATQRLEAEAMRALESAETIMFVDDEEKIL